MVCVCGERSIRMTRVRESERNPQRILTGEQIVPDVHHRTDHDRSMLG